MGVKLKLRAAAPAQQDDDCDENQSVSSFEGLDPPHASRYQKGRFKVTLFPKAERFQKGRFKVTLFHKPTPEADTSRPTHMNMTADACLASTSTTPVLAPSPALARISTGPVTPRSSSACSTPTRSGKSGLLSSLLCCNCVTANTLDDPYLDPAPTNPTALTLDPLSLCASGLPPTDPLAADAFPLFMLPHHLPEALAPPPPHPAAPAPEPPLYPHHHLPAHPHPYPTPAFHAQPPPLAQIRSHSLNASHPHPQRRPSLTTQLSLQPDYPAPLTPPNSLPPPSPRSSQDPFDALMHRHLPHRISLPGPCSSLSSLHSLAHSDCEPLLLPASPTDSASSLAHAHHHHRTSSSHLSYDGPTLNRVETKGRFKVTTCITPRVPAPPAYHDSHAWPPPAHGPASTTGSPAPTPTAQRKGRFLVYDSQPCGMV